MKQISGGLIKEKRDKRNFSFGKVFGTIDLAEIPDDFVVGEPKEKRNPNDYCTAISTTMASELQEGVELNFYWSFAVSKMISGNPDRWGQGLQPALKVHTKYGAISQQAFNISNLILDTLPEEARHIENYPKEFFEIAKKHQKESYFEADGYNQVFDCFRSVLWRNRAQRRAIITGTVLHDKWLQSEDGIVKEEGNPMVGDSFLFIGQKKIGNELYLIAQLSEGKLYFPREMVNKHFNFGGFCFVDEDPEKIKKIAWSFWRYWWEKFIKGFKLYLKILFE